jgi:hypothetical protein
MRWDTPICPLVAGLPAEFDNFIHARISQIALAAHTPFDANHCTANFFVLATYQPDLLLKTLWAHYPGMYNYPNGLGGVEHFLHSSRPIRIWYNVQLHCHDPGTAPISVQKLFIVNGYGSAEYCTGGTRLNYSTVNTVRSVFIVVDMNRMKKITTRELADYVAMIGLADVRLDADAGATPTILRLFQHPKRPPRGLSAWDRALLYSVYNTKQSSVLQVSDMEGTMLARIEHQRNFDDTSSYSSSSASPLWTNLVMPQRGANAIDWYRTAAEQGNSDAQYALGVMYADGQGVPQNYTQAVEWYRKAAERGNANAQSSLGLAYLNGQGIPRDYAKAVQWLGKAAEQGSTASQYDLGIMYADGQGVPQDYANAAQWYRKAAEQGNANAQSSLGFAYANGQGVQRDDAKAVQWFRKAAEKGDADAQYDLAVMYNSGRGVPRDDVMAYMWWMVAKADSSSRNYTYGESVHQLTVSASLMTAEQIALADREASEWLAAHRSAH